MRAFPKPLSAKEEKECITKCRAGDKSAREELIKRNLRLVAYIAKKYNTQQQRKRRKTRREKRLFIEPAITVFGCFSRFFIYSLHLLQQNYG